MFLIMNSLSVWFHTLATIVMIGYFIFTSLIYLPVLERQMQADDLQKLLEEISMRLRPYFGAALLIFLVSGTHLMLINGSYTGLGDFLANPWSILMVTKHALVLVFLTLAVFSERTFMGQISDQRPEALNQFRRVMTANTILGAAILLLTALAQVE